MKSIKQNTGISMRARPHILYVCLVGLFLCTGPSNALANAASGSASAEIRQPVVVSQTTPLSFGSISANGADIVTLSPAGTVSAQNGASISAGSAVPGRFDTAGSASAAVTISFANGSLTGTGAPMVINNLTHDGGATPSFGGDGTFSFAIGADLVIADDQAPGTYSGTYEVSVNYQ